MLCLNKYPTQPLILCWGVIRKGPQLSHSIHFSLHLNYHCFVVSFLLLLFSVCLFVLSSSWDHSPRCHWPCLAELCEKDAEALISLPHSWPSGGVRGQAPRGQAEGDNYPQHCSVDPGKIFLLLLKKSHLLYILHCTFFLQLGEKKILKKSVSWLCSIWSSYNQKKLSHLLWCLSNVVLKTAKRFQSKQRFCLLWNSLRDLGKLWMLCPITQSVWPVDVDGWLEVLSHVCTRNIFPFL